MATLKLASSFMAAATFAVAQGVGAVGLPDISNAHTGKQLKAASTLAGAMKGGSADLQLRLRYEDVADDGVPAPLENAKDADQLSLRTTLGYTTSRYHGLYARVEFEAVATIGDDNAFNVDDDLTFPPGPAGSRIRSGHAVIPDGSNTEANEAYLGWRSSSSGCANAPGGCNGSTTIKAGKQTIIYDNHRWVGNIVWRQNQQSYNAFRIDNTSIDNLSLSYTLVNRVYRLFGENSPFNQWEMDDSHLINISYKTPVGKLVVYGYLLDFEDNPRTPFPEGVGVGPGITNFDSDTVGVRFVGKSKISDGFTFLYELEYANQEPTGDAGPTLDDNNYSNIEFGGAFKLGGKPFIVKVGQEVLEGNGVNALQTPFATVHAFNGWADKFVGAPGGSGTPVGGLEDTSVTLVFKGLIGKSKLVFQYHDYSENTGSVGDYGTEFGALFAKPFSKNVLGLIKYASYSTDVATPTADAFTYDTDKFWLMAQYQFK